MTPMYRWFARDRAQLFASIQHVDTSEISRSGNGWAKIGSDRQTRVLSTLFGKNAPLSAAFSRSHTEHVLFYSSTAYNWLTATRKMPPVYDSDGRLLKQTKYGSLYFDTEEDAWFCLSILTSTFSYWYWLAYGDGFDVTKKLLGSIPLAPARFSRDAYMELVSLGTEIQADMEEHVVYKWNAGKRVGNYNLRLCRHITDRADEVIFASMGFPDEYMKDVMDFCARMIKTDLPVE